MESIYPELALYGSKNEFARTDTVFFPLSQVCTTVVTLGVCTFLGDNNLVECYEVRYIKVDWYVVLSSIVYMV